MTEVVEVPVELLRTAAATTGLVPGAAAERVTARLRAVLASIDQPSLLDPGPPVRDIADDHLPPMVKAPTSRRMRSKAFPRSGTVRLMIVRLVAARWPDGLTDYELEDQMMRSHQSVSAARNGLVNDGWLEPATDPSGVPLERTNRHGNPAQVWVATSRALARLRDGE